MNKYRDKSDFEINKAVAEKSGKQLSLNGNTVFVMADEIPGIVTMSYIFDPCSNPADAMPIVIENGISLINDSGKLFAAAPWVGVDGYLGGEVCGFGSYRYSENDNIYRAAMEVFLMMKDAEK